MKKILFILITLLLTFNVFSQTQVRIVGRDAEGINKLILTNGNGELITMDIDHHDIQKGNHYYFTNNSLVGSGDSVKYVFITPHDSVSNKKAFLLFDVTGSGITQVRVYEGVNDSVHALQTNFNNNRNSSDTSVCKIYLGSTYSDSASTLIYNTKGGSSSGMFRAAGLSRIESEIILKPNTKYKMLINSSTASNLITVIVRWVEREFE